MAITADVDVDDISAVGRKERCDRLCVNLNRAIPAKNLGELKWYSNDVPTEFCGRPGEEIWCDFRTERSA